MRHRPAVRRRVGQEQNDTIKTEVSLLRAYPPFQRLYVEESRLGLHKDPERMAVDHDVGAPQVTGYRDGHFRAPPERRGHATSQTFDQCKVSPISNRGTCRMKADRHLEAEDSRDFRD